MYALYKFLKMPPLHINTKVMLVTLPHLIAPNTITTNIQHAEPFTFIISCIPHLSVRLV